MCHCAGGNMRTNQFLTFTTALTPRHEQTHADSGTEGVTPIQQKVQLQKDTPLLISTHIK